MTHQWFKNAIVYGLDLKVFKDSNKDGIGDMQGLIEKLDYIGSLGFNCIWLQPFHPSPRYDNGYDVCDYYAVDPDLGDLGDFVELIRETDKRGIKVIMDLVVNHTSIEHPWFLEAKSSRTSRYRNYYVWTDEPKDNKEKIMFEDFEDSIWEYSEETDSYYLHRFFKQQADLNIANPAVRKEVLKIMDFWLRLGVSGFRVDAAHIITDPADVEHIDFGNLHEFFDELREFIDKHYCDKVLLGEANVPPDELYEYFGAQQGSKCRMHMLFNFLSNKYTMLAFAKKKATPLVKGLELIKEIHLAHWVNFARHHDELNLELLSDEERQEVFKAFAPEEDMRVFGHGIRRRLPDMFDYDEQKIRAMYNLIFSLPGTPLISYGEEIGMGDEMELQGRESVRTPMQWSDQPNAGFSIAPKEKLYRPVVEKEARHYKNINVLDQQKRPDSLLNFIAMLIRIRKQHPLIGTGRWELLNSDNSAIFAILYEQVENRLLIVCNLSDQHIHTDLSATIDTDQIEEVFCDAPYENSPKTDRLELRPNGFRWLNI